MNDTKQAPDPCDGTIDPTVWAELQELMGPETDDVLAELIDSYLEDTTRQLTLIQEASRNRNPVGLARAIHTLRSPSASLGALKLADLCSDVEGRLRGDDPLGHWPPEHLDTLMAEAERAMAALKARGSHHGRQS